MLKYIVKRLLDLIPAIFIISVVISGAVKGMLGDPVDVYLGVGNRTTPGQKQQIREELGLDKSLPRQYIVWVGNLAKGELGAPTRFKLPVSEIIGDYVWNTFLLNLVSPVIGIGLSIPIGVRQAMKRFSRSDNFWTVFSLLGVSMPTFFFALILIFFVALPSGVVPVSGIRTPDLTVFGYNNVFREIEDIALRMLLPTIVPVLGNFATFSRYVRSSMIDAISQDYIQTARAKGLKEKTVTYRYAFKNTLIPPVILLGLYIPFLFSGAMVLGPVSLRPDLGRISIEAISEQDQSIITACLMFSTTLMTLGNLLLGILYSVIDPHVKVE